MQRPEGFRSLADMLAECNLPGEPQMFCESESTPDAAEPGDAAEAEAEAEAARDLRLFHARIAENVESAVEMLLADIAADVLARELQIAPAVIQSIVAHALQRFAQEKPLRVRLNPCDAGRVCCELPVVPDQGLREGDAVIELRDGWVDISLGSRLANVLVRAQR